MTGHPASRPSDPAAFRASLASGEPPAGLPHALAALWWDARGDWERAHACAMAGGDAASSLVHAYLHRKEGDLANAGYWYARAGRQAASGPLEAEWEALTTEMLALAAR